MAGGVLKKRQYNDFAKIRLDNDLILWYITDIQLSVGDIVEVPFGRENTPMTGEVIHIDYDVPSDVSPVSPKLAKQVSKVIKHNTTK